MTGTPVPRQGSDNGHVREQGTGQVPFASPGFVDLFLNYVLVEGDVKMVEETGTGATGVMRVKPAS